MGHRSNKLRARTQTCYPGIGDGADTQAINGLLLNSIDALQLHSLRLSRHAFFDAHPFSQRPLLSKESTWVSCDPETSEVWDPGSEGPSVALTDYFNSYSCVKTTSGASEVSHVLTQNRWLGRKAGLSFFVRKRTKAVTLQRLIFSPCFFSEICRCCICVYSTPSDKESVALHQDFYCKASIIGRKSEHSWTITIAPNRQDKSSSGLGEMNDRTFFLCQRIKIPQNQLNDCWSCPPLFMRWPI